MFKRTMIAASVIAGGLALSACEFDQAASSFIDKVVDGNNKAHEAVMNGLRHYCDSTPDMVRDQLRARYDGVVEVHCDRLPE